MARRYLTILAVDDWTILTWDTSQRRVQEYVTELWPEWWEYNHGEDDVSVMARFLNRHVPETLSEADSNKFLAWLDERFPGIAAAVRSQS